MGGPAPAGHPRSTSASRPQYLNDVNAGSALPWRAMGVYNTLHVEMPCRRCGARVDRELQIHYGKCQLYHLRPGDAMRWATGQAQAMNQGHPVEGRAWVPAYSNACPSCGDESNYADFAVLINGGMIEGAVQAPLGYIFSELEEVVPLGDEDQPTPVRGG